MQDNSTPMRRMLCAGCLESMAELPLMGGSAFFICKKGGVI
jgi:hypothetical protein